MRKINPTKDDEDRTYIFPSVRVSPPGTTSVPGINWVVEVEYDS
jgi:hypothetical protein